MPATASTRKMAYMDQNLVNYIRPGVKVKIVSAAIAKDGTITARVNITDPKGCAARSRRHHTPGRFPLSLIAAYIPAGQKQYVSYTTTTLKASQPGNTNPAQIQAANDSGGTFDQERRRRLHLHLQNQGAHHVRPHSHPRHRHLRPSQPDRVHDLGRMGASLANDVFNFVPDGSKVTSPAPSYPPRSATLPRSAGRPWRLAPHGGTLHPLPHAADDQSRHRSTPRTCRC